MSTAGIGCRRGCDVREIVEALERALSAAGEHARDLQMLCAPEFKREERGLALAASHFARPLVFLPLSRLQAQSAFALSASQHTQRRFGVPSIAETAALAGALQLTAAERARLLGPRQLVGGASCALARAEVVT